MVCWSARRRRGIGVGAAAGSGLRGRVRCAAGATTRPPDRWTIGTAGPRRSGAVAPSRFAATRPSPGALGRDRPLRPAARQRARLPKERPRHPRHHHPNHPRPLSGTIRTLPPNLSKMQVSAHHKRSSLRAMRPSRRPAGVEAATTAQGERSAFTSRARGFFVVDRVTEPFRTIAAEAGAGAGTKAGRSWDGQGLAGLSESLSFVAPSGRSTTRLKLQAAGRLVGIADVNAQGRRAQPRSWPPSPDPDGVTPARAARSSRVEAVRALAHSVLTLARACRSSAGGSGTSRGYFTLVPASKASRSGATAAVDEMCAFRAVVM
jgi:hypothetical protein